MSNRELSQRKLEEIAQTLSEIHNYRIKSKVSNDKHPYLRTWSPSNKRHNIMYYANEPIPYRVFEIFTKKPQVETKWNDPDDVITFITTK